MTDSHESRRVAVVDDEPDQRRLLRQALEEAGYAVLEAADGEQAVALAREGELDAMILDVRMPGMDGLTALPEIRRARPETAILLLTAYIDVRDAVAAMKAGAHDYLEKPIDLDELVVAVDDALGVSRRTLPDRENDPLVLPPDVVAESAALQALFREAARVAASRASVLISGESGVGKEVVAQYVHAASAAAQGPFVAVNCAAFPENLIESELFGHERGAFTGAVSQRPGRFEQASGGTLFLDEIGEMPMPLQPKLLRVLEERKVRRVGGSREIAVDVRIVSATNRPLREDVDAGRFREDLLYRLNVVNLHIPPLRERREDVLPLAERFLAQERAAGRRFSPAARRALLRHDWPGNVRELRNAVARAAILSPGALILPESLPEAVRRGRGEDAAPKLEPGSILVGDMEEIQKRAILEALEKTEGNKTQAAKMLGISRRNLIYKLRSYGM